MRSAGTPFLPIVLGAAMACAFVTGCDKATHSNIDKWRTTEKGPKKLAKAVRDGDLDADLRAHAAQALVSIEQGTDAIDAVREMEQETRANVIAKLAPRLWDDAKTTGRMDAPSKKQQHAKDALYALRELSTPKQRDQIDDYLVEWLGAFYDGRAATGNVAGEIIVRAVGPKFAPRLIADAREILKTPEQGNKIIPITDELLKGIALSASPDSVGFLLDLGEPPAKHPDESTGIRAIGALQFAFNDYENPANPSALVPHLDRLARMAADEAQDGRNVNIAFALIGATGKQHCVKPLAKLASHRDEVRMWQAVQTGIKCAGAEGVVAMAEALPQDRKIPRGIFEKYFWDKVVDLGKDGASPARTLLGSKSWVGRITGIHILARAGTKNDAVAVRELQGDKTKLKGWWGERDPTGRKPDPTLGSEAVAVADLLEKKR